MKLTFFDKRNETADVSSFLFKSTKPLSFRAGQFMFYTLPNANPDERGITRYFTISSAPYEEYIMITTRFNKDGSSTFKKALWRIKPGDTIEATGPDGDFIAEDPDKEYVFIAGGIGITPYRSILLDFDHRKLPINATLLYANRDEDIVFKKELESLTRANPNFKIRYFISPAHVTEADINTLDSEFSILNSRFYISGPEPMVEAFGEMLKSMGIYEKNIKQDFFPGYQIDM